MSAIFALKGYRTQFLYSLYKLLIEYNNNYIFQPEGKFEDLDILDLASNYVEIIQIKNKNATLTYSDLISKSDSFFRRAENALIHSPKAIIKLVSFSEISEEITNTSKLAAKLKKSGFKDVSVKSIQENFQSEIVNETEVKNRILQILKETSLFSDPNIALELLLYWLFIAGENQESIVSKQIIERLEKIGKFINEQTSFNLQFGNTIVPFSTKSIEQDDIEVYREGFYYGVAAKYEHILANLDVNRIEKIDAIENAFKNNNIVFIHGASGQGKSTLAYRYINNFTSDQTAYELKLSQNLVEIYQTINSLDSLSKGLDFPVLLYIDIKPQDIYWNNILKELYGKKNLRFLITIRQEDWNVTSLGIDFKFSEIDLNFNKHEAKIIYESLSEFKQDLKFIDFEESWDRFQNKGMLLEYVYLINQGDTLKSRLEQQIRAIEVKVVAKKTDELEILRYVCLADVFNSKISFKQLATNLKIKTPKFYIDYFEKEYLLQYSDNKEYVTGLHPIRSKLLCEILFDESNFVDINCYIKNSLNLIDEKDLQVYLLESFIKGFEIDVCIDVLRQKKFNTWSAYAGILNALLWKGVYDFVFVNNITVINRLYSELNGLWSFNIPFDFTNKRDKGIYGICENYYSDEKRQAIDLIHKDFTSKEIVYDYVKSWLLNISSLTASTVNSIDVKSLGEINFWISLLGLDIKTIQSIDELSQNLTDDLSLKDFSILLFGLQLNNFNVAYVKEIKDQFILRLRNDNNLIFFEETAKIESKYFYDAIAFDNKSYEEGDIFNKMSMKIIDLLRYAFPDKEIYSIKGLGLSFFGFEMPHDPTRKEIPLDNIPNPFLVTNNALVGNLYDFQFKPSDWSEYITLVTQKRLEYVELTSSLILKFEEYFKTNDFQTFVNSLKEIQEKSLNIKPIPFPKNISDKWGYISDGSNINGVDADEHIKSFIEGISSLRKYSKLKGLLNSYFNALGGFFNNLETNVINVLKIRLSLNENDDYNPNPAFINIKNALKNAPLLNQEIILLFEKFLEENKSNIIFEKENKNLQVLFNCWHQFYFKKGDLHKKIVKQTNANFEIVKLDIRKRLLSERKNIFKETGFQLNVNLAGNLNILVLTCEINSNEFINSVVAARQYLQRTVNANFISVKSIYIENNIKKAIFIPLFSGKPINKIAVEIMLFNLDKELGEEGTFFNPFYQIEDEVKDLMKFEFWNEIIPSVSDCERVIGDLATLKELWMQIENIKKSEPKLDTIGINILEKYKEKITSFLIDRVRISSASWDNIKGNFDDEQLRDEITNILNLYLNDRVFDLEQVGSILESLESNYRPFVEKVIELNRN